MTGPNSAARVAGIDHVAITVADLDATCAFYGEVLGGMVVGDHKPDGTTSAVRQVRIGGAHLSVHQQGNGIELVARAPTPGSADLCFRWSGSIDEAVAALARCDVPLVVGPVPRSSSRDKRGASVYFKDPDGNLIELLAED